MKKLLIPLILSCSLLLASELNTISPSFDCSNETKLNRVEKLICSDEALINYQKEIERQYKLVSKLVGTNDAGRKNRNVSEIYQYLNDKRDKCKTKECLLKFYDTYDFFVGAIEWSMQEINEKFEHIETNAAYNNHVYLTDEQTIEKNTKLCNNLYNDLSSNFNNITIIKPIVQLVPYDDERLKEALGSCYEARMDLNKLPYRSIDGLGYFSLWSVDIDKDGKEEIIFVQYDKSLKGNEVIWYLLDKDACKEKLQQPNFNPEKDNTTLAYDFVRSYGVPITPPMLIDYGNETRIVDLYKREIRLNFDTYGNMRIYTFYTSDFEKPKKSFSEDVYSMGSYKLFDDTCDITFKKDKQTK